MKIPKKRIAGMSIHHNVYWAHILSKFGEDMCNQTQMSIIFVTWCNVFDLQQRVSNIKNPVKLR